jgi:hypothetical protein
MGGRTRAMAGVLIGLICWSVEGCGLTTGSADVTLTNDTGQVIRVTGNCTDADASELRPGQTVNMLYLGADCRIDNGDGLHGVLGCVTLSEKHTDLTRADLRPIAGPEDCWGGGTRWASPGPSTKPTA